MKAINETQRRGVLERIAQVWDRFPNLRLGQLLVNAQGVGAENLFYIEDMELATRAEQFALRHAVEVGGKSPSKKAQTPEVTEPEPPAAA